MAYQPIQMPTPNAFGGLAEIILAARRQSQQEEQARADLLLRRQQHEAQVTQNYAQQQHQAQELGLRQSQETERGAHNRLIATQQVTAALDQGRPDLARQIAKTAGLGDITEQRQDPKDALMMPSFETPTQKPTPPPTMDLEKANDPAAVQANEKAIADYQTQLAGYHPGRTQYEFGGMRPVRDPTYMVAGEKYDPLQTRMATEARRNRDIEQVRGAFGPLGYGDEAAALAAANTQDKPLDISGLISKRMERDNAREAARTEKETNREFIRGENEKYRSEGKSLEDIYALARIAADAKKDHAAALAGPRQDQGDLQSRKYVDETVGRYEKTSGIPKLLQTVEMFNLASRELQKPSGAAQVGARMAIERALRGGPPTQYMDEQEQKHLSGVMGRLEGALETLSTGQFGEEQKQAIMHEIDAARAEYETAVDRRYQGIAARLKGDPAFGNLQGTVNRRVQQTFAPFGRQVPDIFPGGEDKIGAIGSRSVAGQARTAAPVPPKPETVGLTDDPNDESPLPEDPNAEELPPAQKLVSAARASKAQERTRANKLLGKPNITREQALEELRRRGLIP